MGRQNRINWNEKKGKETGEQKKQKKKMMMMTMMKEEEEEEEEEEETKNSAVFYAMEGEKEIFSDRVKSLSPAIASHSGRGREKQTLKPAWGALLPLPPFALAWRGAAF
jgi:hypothetical protein